MTRFLLMCALLLPVFAGAQGVEGYYRYPAIHDNFILFTAEGDLWKVGDEGGLAQRLTTHPGKETNAAISQDGKWVAYSAEYEGPTEVYVMPVAGGIPIRCTFEGETAIVVGWTPQSQVLYTTQKYSGLPNWVLATYDLEKKKSELLPLYQANDGNYNPQDNTLFFTRLPFQGSRTKRYVGGTAQNIWKFPPAGPEALSLTADYSGTSKNPMYWDGRVYYISDQDGTMNLWSMNTSGADRMQHTFHSGMDIANPCLQNGRIVYQQVADIFIYDIASATDKKLRITLVSDFDQKREKWVQSPMDYLSSASISPDGDRAVLISRGQVFIFPVKDGRMVEVSRKQGVRYRDARFMPDGENVLAYSDESGEMEFEILHARGIEDSKVLSSNPNVFRYEHKASPDGALIAFADKNFKLWFHDIKKKKTEEIARSEYGSFYHLSWSPDSKWLAYICNASNQYSEIHIYDINKKKDFTLTGDRVDSYRPAWTPDGKYLYFLSDRFFASLVRSPWGPRQPEPFFDKTTKLYVVPLSDKDRSPFLPDDELKKAGDKKETGEKKETKKDEKVSVTIAFENIQKRITEIPVPAGSYSNLEVSNTHLFWVSSETSQEGKRNLMALEIKNTDIEAKTLVEDIDGFDISGNAEKLMIIKKKDLYVIDAGSSAPADLNKQKLNLNGWRFTVNPGEEWRQMFIEAWRLERDYFYDPNMHGVDYNGLLNRYLPYVERVTDRAELSDLIAHLVGELSALHTFVFGGDQRKGDDDIKLGALGADLVRDEAAGGYRIEHIIKGDPDYQETWSPLAKPGLDICTGEIIIAINGVSLLQVQHPSELLRNQVDQQVLLEIKSPSKEKRKVIVKPVSAREERDLRYSEWELERRLYVESASEEDIGYVHLRAMSGDNYSEWVRNFYPVFNRKGLVIDVRHNRGGNIDSWILEKLLRKAWFYWQGRVGQPTWNMQYAFRGHMVVLCNEFTASDGEAFAEGFRRLGLGKVIGTRTWGGEIWLSYNTHLVDQGMASAAQTGVYGPEGEWLIEGHGVVPDIVVDNLPHETYNGRDAQLEAAIQYLQQKIKAEPVAVPPPPQYPDKSFDYEKENENK